MDCVEGPIKRDLASVFSVHQQQLKTQPNFNVFTRDCGSEICVIWTDYVTRTQCTTHGLIPIMVKGGPWLGVQRVQYNNG